MTFLSEKKKEDDEKIKVKKVITVNAWLAHIYIYIYIHTLYRQMYWVTPF